MSLNVGTILFTFFRNIVVEDANISRILTK